MELPKYLDLLLILNDQETTRIVQRKLQKNKDYVFAGVKYLEEKGMIDLIVDNDCGRRYKIKLLDKGKDAQKIISMLFNKFR